MKTEIRPAEPEDAEDLARLINLASEGMSLYLWQQSAPEGQDPWEYGRERACDPAVGFNWRNSVVATLDGVVAGSVVFYALPEEPQPIAADVPEMFIPILELENLAPNTVYINVLAVYPEYRGRGIGRALMEHVEAEASGRDLSLIVENANDVARSLYHSFGFVTEASRPIVDGGWVPSGDAYCLMVRRSV
jgi:ribosomal protein S18 acetylase RimI-like enzyme